MITYKGRVVYERIEHKMTEKDAARILKSTTKEKSPAELAKTLWGIDVEVIELRVMDDQEMIEILSQFLSLIIRYVGIGADWLWDLFISLLGATPGVAVPDAPIEEPENEEETNG